MRKSRIRPSPSELGTSMLELLIGLVILALIWSAAAVSVDFFRTRARSIESVAKLDSLLTRARTAAQHDGTVTTVVFNLAEGSIRGVDETLLLPADQKMVVTSAAELAGSDTRRVIFFPDGTSSGGSITIDALNGQYRRHLSWLTSRVTDLPQ